MGRNAAEKIEEICGNTNILQQHLEFRKGVQRSGTRTFDELFANHFPEFAGAHSGSTTLERLIREQPVHLGKKTANLIRRMKRKMKVPVPSAISQDIYRFLSRK